MKKRWIILSLLMMILLACLVYVNHFRQEGKKDMGNVSTTEISDYEEIRNTDTYSRLLIFPKKITEEAKEPEFIFQHRWNLFDSTIQIYLKCSYSDEEYEREIERLAQIEEELEGKSQTVRYDTEHFSVPAYAAAFAHNQCYEYALPLGNNEIVYVFLQFVDEKQILFPKEYLPLVYERFTETEGYSIYVFPMENGIFSTTY